MNDGLLITPFIAFYFHRTWPSKEESSLLTYREVERFSLHWLHPLPSYWGSGISNQSIPGFLSYRKLLVRVACFVIVWTHYARQLGQAGEPRSALCDFFCLHFKTWRQMLSVKVKCFSALDFAYRSNSRTSSRLPNSFSDSWQRDEPPIGLVKSGLVGTMIPKT